MVTIQGVLSLGRATRLKGMKIPRQFDLFHIWNKITFICWNIPI